MGLVDAEVKASQLMTSVATTLDPLFTTRGLERCPGKPRWVRQAHRFGVVVEMYRRVASKPWTLGWGLWVVGALPDEKRFPSAAECHALERIAVFTTPDDLWWEGPGKDGVIIERAHGRQTLADMLRIEGIVNTALDELFTVQSAEQAWRLYETWHPTLPYGMSAFELALEASTT
jgi:hypothetical protein